MAYREPTQGRHGLLYEATFTAIQKSPVNTGAGQVTYFYQPPTRGRPPPGLRACTLGLTLIAQLLLHA